MRLGHLDHEHLTGHYGSLVAKKFSGSSRQASVTRDEDMNNNEYITFRWLQRPDTSGPVEYQRLSRELICSK